MPTAHPTGYQRQTSTTRNPTARRLKRAENFVLEGQKLCVFSRNAFMQRLNYLNESLCVILQVKDSAEKALKTKNLLSEIIQTKDGCNYDLIFSEFNDFTDYVNNGCFFQLTFPWAVELLNDVLFGALKVYEQLSWTQRQT
ncbi:MAG: hypothetical protein MHMPM18_003613 [Marteilia pararefringens]